MEIIDFLQQWGALILSAISLLVAVISLIKSSKAQILQNKINEIELKLKEYELEKVQSEKEEAEKSCVEAKIIKISDGKYKVKVWNSGSVKVKNVNVNFEDGPIIGDKEMLPYEELEPNKSFDLWVLVYMGTNKKFFATTSWTDSAGKEKSKKQLISL